MKSGDSFPRYEMLQAWIDVATDDLDDTSREQRASEIRAEYELLYARRVSEFGDVASEHHAAIADMGDVLERHRRNLAENFTADEQRFLSGWSGVPQTTVVRPWVVLAAIRFTLGACLLYDALERRNPPKSFQVSSEFSPVIGTIWLTCLASYYLLLHGVHGVFRGRAPRLFTILNLVLAFLLGVGVWAILVQVNEWPWWSFRSML
jgi:hypothetical protein